MQRLPSFLQRPIELDEFLFELVLDEVKELAN